MARNMRSLAGTWELLNPLDSTSTWCPISVPGCWETPNGPKDISGPFYYRTMLSIPTEALGKRIWLEFDGVSYACVLLLDSHEIAQHTGMWDSFQVDLTDRVTPGSTVELMLLVEKPAGLSAGPDSASLDGRFPLRSTLVGFLPYVWGQIFGGIWQDVRLCYAGPTLITSLHATGRPDGSVAVELYTTGTANLLLELFGPDGSLVATRTVSASTMAEQPIHTTLTCPTPQPWSPTTPVLYSLRATLGNQDRQTVRFGLRELHAQGTDLLLNDQPIYPRMALSWGWYNDRLHCNPSEAQVREEFARLKQLGYNGVKLCLWVPPRHYFELADELGMLLWLELPLWLPQPNEHFRKQISHEYEAIVRQVRQHPSIILYTLGCELNQVIGPDVLQPLFALVKTLVPDTLVRDNSGSGEAYGGLLQEYAEFYDYHFYSELQFFRDLIDYFTPRWRPVQPWVFGEFCDLDSFRDLNRLQRNWPDGMPWWMSPNPAINPQGARWQFDLPFLEERLRSQGLWEHSAEYERLSHQHALLHRKWTLETVRQYREIGGYVITGEVDTPISTAGMWDDFGHLKFPAHEFRAFNDDLVALVGWDKRRAWVEGGDRAAYWDSWCYTAGKAVRPHLLASNYSTHTAPAHANWRVVLAGQQIAAGECHGPIIQPGEVREIGIGEFRVPAVATPCEAHLEVTLRVGLSSTSNSWPLWFFPATPWQTPPGTALYDPAAILQGLDRIMPSLACIELTDQASIAVTRTIIATHWEPALERFASQGGLVILLEQGHRPGGPIPVLKMPFWREALRVIEPHPAWGDFPHTGWAALQFYGCATDQALILSDHPQARPLLRRVDTRTMASHAYIAELPLGQGRVIASTLRFQGGHGDQPAGITANIAAAYLLLCLARTPMP